MSVAVVLVGEFIAPPLEQLRCEILQFAVENPVLDESVLKDHLCTRGFAETLSGLEKRDSLALDRAASAGLSPDEVLLRWREALATQQRIQALRPAARRARADWARDQSEGARRSLDEAEAALARSFEAASGDGDADY